MSTIKSSDVNQELVRPREQSQHEEVWNEFLRDDTPVTVRPIHAVDVELERGFIESMSSRSRHFRFLEEMRSPSDELLRKMTSIDPATDVAYIALITVGKEKRQIGVARFSAKLNENNCEFAVAVSDEYQKNGLGRILMRHLINAARTRGISSMYSNDASDNDLMRKFAEHLGFQHQRDPNDMTQITYSLDIKPQMLKSNSVA